MGFRVRPDSLRAGHLQNMVRRELRAIDGGHHDAAAASRCFKRQIAYAHHALSQRLIHAHVLQLDYFLGARHLREESRLVTDAVAEHFELDQPLFHMAGYDDQDQETGDDQQPPQAHVFRSR